MLATLAAASPVEADAPSIELEFVVAGVVGMDVGALRDGEDTGAGSTGDDVGVVDVGVVDVGVVAVWVGCVGEVTAVELRFVVPDVVGFDVGALPDGEDTGAGPTGDEVDVVEVWVGFTGDATGVEGPVGAEVGGCGEAGVGVGIGIGAPAVAVTASKRNAFPLLSTATQDEPGEQETAFRLPRRSSRAGVDHVEPS